MEGGELAQGRVTLMRRLFGILCRWVCPDEGRQTCAGTRSAAAATQGRAVVLPAPPRGGWDQSLGFCPVSCSAPGGAHVKGAMQGLASAAR